MDIYTQKRKYDGCWIKDVKSVEDSVKREVTRTFVLNDGRELERKLDKVALMNQINAGLEHFMG
jgi:hypothetical protein